MRCVSPCLPKHMYVDLVCLFGWEAYLCAQIRVHELGYERMLIGSWEVRCGVGGGGWGAPPPRLNPSWGCGGVQTPTQDERIGQVGLCNVRHRFVNDIISILERFRGYLVQGILVQNIAALHKPFFD